jgi:hypothetical protein
MYVAPWLVWPVIVVGWAFGLGFAVFGTAWIWLRGIELWLDLRNIRGVFNVALFDALQAKKREEDSQEPTKVSGFTREPKHVVKQDVLRKGLFGWRKRR